jgi:hypothetical protein
VLKEEGGINAHSVRHKMTHIMSIGCLPDHDITRTLSLKLRVKMRLVSYEYLLAL